MPTVESILASVTKIEQLAATSAPDVSQVMATVCHDLRLQAIRQTLPSTAASNGIRQTLPSTAASNGIALLPQVAQQQAQYQAKLADLRVLRADVFKHLCKRGQTLNMAFEQLGETGYRMLLIEQQISSNEADDCRALAQYAADVDRWAYALNGEILITSIKQVISLVRLWYEQGRPKPEFEPVNAAFH